jgi:hypothetical protein
MPGLGGRSQEGLGDALEQGSNLAHKLITKAWVALVFEQRSRVPFEFIQKTRNIILESSS